MKKHLLLNIMLLSSLGATTHIKGMLLAAGAVMSNTDAPLKKLLVGETYRLDGYSPDKYKVEITGDKRAIRISKTQDGKAFEITALKPCSKHDNVGVVVTKKDAEKSPSKQINNFIIAYPDLNALPDSFKEGDHVLIARTKDDKDSIQKIKPIGEDKGVVRISASKRYISIKMQEDGKTDLHGHDDNDNKIGTKKITVLEKSSDDKK